LGGNNIEGRGMKVELDYSVAETFDKQSFKKLNRSLHLAKISWGSGETREWNGQEMGEGKKFQES